MWLFPAPRLQEVNRGFQEQHSLRNHGRVSPGEAGLSLRMELDEPLLRGAAVSWFGDLAEPSPLRVAGRSLAGGCAQAHHGTSTTAHLVTPAGPATSSKRTSLP